MADVAALLALTRSVAAGAAERLLDSADSRHRSHVYSREIPREIKALADTVLEEEILAGLRPAGIPILSEEAGQVLADGASPYRFIVDPLDGTFNFVKGLGPCAVSIALWEGERPLFGVVYSLQDRQLAWGGATLGAFLDGRPIHVSDVSDPRQASICTGFPVRFDLTSEDAMAAWCLTVQPFAKVRMLGSAAMSLVRVACGAADVYAEQGIMLWDVAAGVAIVEGASGQVLMDHRGDSSGCQVLAGNAALLSHLPIAANTHP